MRTSSDGARLEKDWLIATATAASHSRWELWTVLDTFDDWRRNDAASGACCLLD
eukprot:CAMPEP_0174852702 /NCGR_PEP_ID=MMETSP1114-20130205/26401_1 /TAXON_ID=312471 /ORGANISM="Neobodo designis, Strain CCAP 1951/1" /LENGTH=53 /DNA_ID=CAMNT_0016087311 /DNA_START=67 /DNA_END=225 /DNA_ORIENTATION=-